MVYIFLCSLTISIILFYFFKKISFKFNLVDKPDELSVHKNIVPTGAGIIFCITFVCLLFFANFLSHYNILDIIPPKNFIIFLSSLLLLTIISFYDDLKKIHPVIRLFFQLTIIFFCCSLFDTTIPNIPLKLLIIFIVYFWVYTINIINFTDGVDGFLGLNSLNYFLCTSIFYAVNSSSDFGYLVSVISVGIMISYLYFNKPKATLFMGDTGSIFLGFLIGYIAIKLIFIGRYDIIISLLAYTYLDCTLTILKKILTGKMPWARLFDYYFLIPVKNNQPHKKVFLANLVYNISIFIIVLVQILFEIKIICILSLLCAIILIYYFKSFEKAQYRK